MQFMGVSGRQAGQPGNYLNNPPTGWRNNMNQNWDWKQDAGNAGRQPMYQQQQQQQYPSLQDKTSKLEEALEKFMHATMTYQKNQEASMRNLETQVGQLAKQMAEQQGGQFLANTQTNPKEQCKAITIRCGKQVGSNLGTEVADDKKKPVNRELEAQSSKNRLNERVEPEAVITEENRDSELIKAKEGSIEDSVQKQVEKGQYWRKIEEGIPLKHVPYPHALSRREAERQFI